MDWPSQKPGRHWTDTIFAVAALAVSGISLWIGIGTEKANDKMVAAESWPFLQIQSSNNDDNGHPRVELALVNAGVGPAKLESLEIVWQGKAYSSSEYLLSACCGFRAYAFPSTGHTPVSTSGVHDIVIRAGETLPFLDLPLGADNDPAWHALDRERFKMHFCACYCSVFDDCWVSDLKQLHPQRVDKCPVPKVAYLE